MEGATALAVPTRLGQWLSVEAAKDSFLYWKSIDFKNEVWFEGKFSLTDFEVLESSDNKISERLVQIFQAVKNLNPNLFNNKNGYSIETRLEFDREWGLGSSSTLIYNLASWAGISPYVLLEKTFGGSGYDLACAGASSPILYTIKNNQPVVEAVQWKPEFYKNLYFIYLGQKQNSRDGIRRFRERMKDAAQKETAIFTELTQRILNANDIKDFIFNIKKHEAFVGELLDMEPVLSKLFRDFKGGIKSLGAWGGDFVLAATEENKKYVLDYFHSKGMEIIFEYEDLIL